MKTAIDKFWGTFGHLDIDFNEPLDADDVRSGGDFTEDDIKELIAADLVVECTEESD
jgi:hypothetical protein